MTRLFISSVALSFLAAVSSAFAQVVVGPYEQGTQIPIGPGLTYDKYGNLTLLSGTSGTQYSLPQIIRTGSQTIGHAFVGTNVLTTDTSGTPTYTFSNLQVGDWGWVEQGGTTAITFSGVQGTTTTGGQYTRVMWYFDGTKVIVK